ncbi:MAG TPA: GGDEF domain-containing protein [Bradyrhizobium sp.]|nr:GGDEF domain-containing protein [Bradyrhizobium sp.]
MYLQRMGSRTGSISDSVYMEVIRTLHGTIVPILLAAMSQAIVGAITVEQTGDVLIGVLATVGVLVDTVRACEVVAFRRRAARKPPLELAEARVWGWCYALGTTATSLMVGLLAARSLTLDSEVCTMMAIGIAFGFGAGIIARLSLLPFLALADLFVLGVPAIAVSFARLDMPHIGLALLIAIYVVGSFEMVRLTFNSTVDHIKLKEEFEQLARLDPMTGVFNRSLLTSELPRLIAERDDGLLAIHAIDLDHFKAANDRFGHPVGDALLKQVAGRLKALAGPRGSVVRMGGDEFILVQPATRSRDDAAALAQRILDSVSATYVVEGHDIVIGASIGVAVAPDDGESVEALLSRSDKALYQAKAGRGGYVIAHEIATAQPVVDKPASHQRAA